MKVATISTTPHMYEGKNLWQNNEKLKKAAIQALYWFAVAGSLKRGAVLLSSHKVPRYSKRKTNLRRNKQSSSSQGATHHTCSVCIVAIPSSRTAMK